MTGIRIGGRASPARPITRQRTCGIARKAGLAARLSVGGAMLSMLGGCINITAPSEPIVIELNINIRQEVIYRLAGDVKENIDANPDIF